MNQEKMCSVIESFGVIAGNRPEGTAIIFQDSIITYKELAKASDKIAARLNDLGIYDSLIGICFNRNPNILTAILAVWKSGNAYVPLDPDYPLQRLEYIVNDADIPVILFDNGTVNTVDRLEVPKRINLDDDFESADDFCAHLPESNDSAYAIYTSGSTGKPKGVLISHGAFGNFINSMVKCPGINENDKMLFNTTISFDISTLEMFLPLVVGAAIVMSPYGSMGGGGLLASLIDDNGVTIAQGTPSMWQMLIVSGWTVSKNIKLLSGGEAISSELAKELLVRCDSLWNMYGPTETTVWSMVSKIESSDDINLGQPVDNTTIYILDENMKSVNPGESGELFIGGAGLSKGYIGRDDLTAERFISGISEINEKIYKTGDIVSLGSDGKIVYQGRADFQVKLRGHRIELGEIESAIAEYPSIKQAAVVLHENNSGDKSLVAFYTLKENAENVDDSLIKSFIENRLPSYMIPYTYIRLDSFPLTANGKLDRKALMAMEVETVTKDKEFIEPRNEFEEMIADIWCQLLNTDRVSVNDDFLELGGHSLLANRLVMKINKDFGTTIKLVEIFSRPMTVEEMAILVEENMLANLSEEELAELMKDQ